MRVGDGGFDDGEFDDGEFDDASGTADESTDDAVDISRKCRQPPL
jgi:hypothetical protein